MQPVPTRPLVPLPPQPDGVAWPTTAWPTADPADLGGDAGRLTALLDELVDTDDHPVFGQTYAAAVVVRGRLVAERYGRRVVQDLRALEPGAPLEAVAPTDRLLSWSMAKSLTSLAVGVAVGDGALRVEDPVADPQWAGDGDPRAAITWDDLLTMRPGLAWNEEYYEVDGDRLPDVITMLFGDGASDMAAFAASFPLEHPPGTPEAYAYSSGTTNIIAANLQRVLGLDQAGMLAFLHDRILDPIGLTDLDAHFDPAGTFIGSSYAFATLQDWCRFGLLAERDGVWDGVRLIPEGWMDYSRRPRSWEDEYKLHGAQWWTWDRDDTPFAAHGFEGQRVICFPTRDVIVVRFGKTGPDHAQALTDHLGRMAALFPEG